MSRQERLENWTSRIMACRGSGMTVRAWCQENGLSEKTYYYWQRRLFQTLSEQQAGTAFAEIKTPRPVCSGNVAVTVRIDGAEADIHSGADAAAGLHQSSILGRQRICAALQAAGIRQLPVAPVGKGSQSADHAAVPLAHGGAECGSAKGAEACKRSGNSLRNIIFYCTFQAEYGIMST